MTSADEMEKALPMMYIYSLILLSWLVDCMTFHIFQFVWLMSKVYEC